MNLKLYLYRMRKRISDKQLLELQKIITEEIARRETNDVRNEVKAG